MFHCKFVTKCDAVNWVKVLVLSPLNVRSWFFDVKVKPFCWLLSKEKKTKQDEGTLRVVV